MKPPLSGVLSIICARKDGRVRMCVYVGIRAPAAGREGAVFGLALHVCPAVMLARRYLRQDIHGRTVWSVQPSRNHSTEWHRRRNGTVGGMTPPTSARISARIRRVRNTFHLMNVAGLVLRCQRKVGRPQHHPKKTWTISRQITCLHSKQASSSGVGSDTRQADCVRGVQGRKDRSISGGTRAGRRAARGRT